MQFVFKYPVIFTLLIVSLLMDLTGGGGLYLESELGSFFLGSALAVLYFLGGASFLRFVVARKRMHLGWVIPIAFFQFWGWFTLMVLLAQNHYRPSMLLIICLIASFRLMRHKADDGAATPPPTDPAIDQPAEENPINASRSVSDSKSTIIAPIVIVIVLLGAFLAVAHYKNISNSPSIQKNEEDSPEDDAARPTLVSFDFFSKKGIEGFLYKESGIVKSKTDAGEYEGPLRPDGLVEMYEIKDGELGSRYIGPLKELKQSSSLPVSIQESTDHNVHSNVAEKHFDLSSLPEHIKKESVEYLGENRFSIYYMSASNLRDRSESRLDLIIELSVKDRESLESLSKFWHSRAASFVEKEADNDIEYISKIKDQKERDKASDELMKRSAEKIKSYYYDNFEEINKTIQIAYDRMKRESRFTTPLH